MSYSRNINLENNEIAAKINIETGELTEVKPITYTNKDSSKIKFDKVLENVTFSRNYPLVWKWLYNQLTPTEYKVCHGLAMRARAFTNSLEPLNEDSTIRDIAYEFDIAIGYVKPLLAKLFSLGVYGKFEVQKETYQKYWVLNPYLSFNGKVADKGLIELFVGTKIEKVFHNNFN